MQTRLESSEFNTPYLYSQTKESGNVNQLKNDDSCIVTTELSKSPEHTNIDLRAIGIKENEQSTASEIYLNRQSMEINDITNLIANDELTSVNPLKTNVLYIGR